jgi:hypothetical protein
MSLISKITETLGSPEAVAPEEDILLAVAFGVSKTVIWQAKPSVVTSVLEKLIAGEKFNDVIPALGDSIAANNSIDQATQLRAEELEGEAEAFIDLTDTASFQEALDELKRYLS